jgi:hypothetical protein
MEKTEQNIQYPVGNFDGSWTHDKGDLVNKMNL